MKTLAIKRTSKFRNCLEYSLLSLLHCFTLISDMQDIKCAVFQKHWTLLLPNPKPCSSIMTTAARTAANIGDSIKTISFPSAITPCCSFSCPPFYGLLWKQRVWFSLRQFLDIVIMIAELYAAAPLTVE